jgi:hypothetical protein
VKPWELAAEMPDGREPTLRCDVGDRGFGLTKQTKLGHPALEDPLA